MVKKIGILGGTFDPPHLGHLEISKFAARKLKLNSIIWAVTKKNPLKKKPMMSLKKRILLSRKIAQSLKKIKIKSYDNRIKSSETINLIKFLKPSSVLAKIGIFPIVSEYLKFICEPINGCVPTLEIS